MAANKIVYVSFLCILLVQSSIGGFICGAPCSQRNTAYIGPVKTLYPLAQVKCVDMTGMGINRILTKDTRLVTADSLYADHMNLKILPPVIFHILPNLQLVDVSGNHIRKIPREMNRLAPYLKTYLLADNKIKIPPKGILLRSVSLDTLMLSNNHIRSINAATFARLPKLRVLYLDGNRLTRINPAVFKYLKNLKYLHLGNNRLKVMPPQSRMPPSLKVYITKGNTALVKYKRIPK